MLNRETAKAVLEPATLLLQPLRVLGLQLCTAYPVVGNNLDATLKRPGLWHGPSMSAYLLEN